MSQVALRISACDLKKKVSVTLLICMEQQILLLCCLKLGVKPVGWL